MKVDAMMEMRIEIMGSNGFSAKCIQAAVKRYDGEIISTSTIYKALKDLGIKLWDYRNGKSKTSKQRLAILGVRQSTINTRGRRKAG
jgi:hypothetical protein|tara:strand:+ start:351 stop:611 length:261 start_codon:yes stop_codon:yes gene_type:complete